MDLLETKILTFGYISGKENLTNQEKIQLLDFVKEASEIQTLNLLATGKMKTEKEILKQGQHISVETVKEQLESQLSVLLEGVTEWPSTKSPSGSAYTTGPGYKAPKGLSLPSAKESPPGSAYAAGGLSGMEIGAAVALGAAAITAGVLAYKRFFSKAAKACKDKSGAEKTSCMKSYKAQGKQAELGVLTAKINSCKGNPKCVNRIKSRITKAKQEIQALKAKK
jgi:succinate dehydrogenase/fumarate reductase flavoprotein subunit